MEKHSLDEVLIVAADQCTGCGICELICSMAKFGEYNPKKSYIRVIRNSEMDVNIVVLSLSCDYCAKCVDWCPTKAIKFVSVEEAARIRKENHIGVFPAPLIG